MKDYANAVFYILELNKYFDEILTRESCICLNIGNTNIYIKDITIFNSSDCVLFDNSIMTFGLNLDKSVLVSSFNGESDDTEFQEILLYIKANEDIPLQKLFNDFFCFMEIYHLLTYK